MGTKESTSLIWNTLRAIATWPRYRDNFSDIAIALIETVNQEWPMGKTGELLCDSVLVLAYYSKDTIDAWTRKHSDCYYEVSSSRNTEPWYWIALWASRETLNYYMERV